MRRVLEAECVPFAGSAGLPKQRKGSVLISLGGLFLQQPSGEHLAKGKQSSSLPQGTLGSLTLGGSSTLAISEMKLVFWTQRVLEQLCPS